ncbi:MAG TPA: methylmalonyl-CoA epimerase [Saprospiraceae bacterium]|nr:methylmalonyl-CoA epimerase [Saprospiraceae bacterium]
MYSIEHIGIAVKSLDESDSLFQKLLGSPPYKHEEVTSEGVITSFFRTDNSKVELLQAIHPDSAIQRFIDRRGEGLHHIAFEVNDIKAEMKRLKEEGFELLREEPFRGADNKWVCFVHPRSANGVLVELCQTIPDAILTDDALES